MAERELQKDVDKVVMLLDKLEYRDTEIGKSDAHITLTYCKVIRELDKSLAHIEMLKKQLSHLTRND